MVKYLLGLAQSFNKDVMMADLLQGYDAFIQQEMLIHPPLFTHGKASTIAIASAKQTTLVAEALKHPNIRQVCQVSESYPTGTLDSRVEVFVGKTEQWLTKITPDCFDLIINADISTATLPNVYQQYLSGLHHDGIFVQPIGSFFQLQTLKNIHQALRHAGFHDIQFLNYPQTSGWIALVMAIKHGSFKRIREKDIFNKAFSTHFYNFDTHKASLVLPEFMREELAL